MSDRVDRHGEPAEAALVRAAQAGEPDAFGELFVRYHPRGLAFCRRQLGADVHTAQQVASATFETMLTGIGAVRDPNKVGSWLFSCARRHHLALARDAQVERAVPDPHAVTGSAEPATPDVACAVLTRLTAEQVLDRLDPSATQLLREHYLDDISLREMERRHWWATGTGKVLLHRARARARAAAQALGLPALLPVAWWRWWRGRAAHALRVDPASAAVLIVQALGAGMLLVPPASAAPVGTAPGARQVGTAAHSTPQGAFRLSRPDGAAGGGRVHDGAAGGAAVADEPWRPMTDHPWQAFGTDAPSLPGNPLWTTYSTGPHYQIGVSADRSVAGQPLDAHVTDDGQDERTEWVYGTGCAAATITPALGYCHRIGEGG